MLSGRELWRFPVGGGNGLRRVNKGESPSLLGKRDIIEAAKASRLPLRAEADPFIFGLGPLLLPGAPAPADVFAWE